MATSMFGAAPRGLTSVHFRDPQDRPGHRDPKATPEQLVRPVCRDRLDPSVLRDLRALTRLYPDRQDHPEQIQLFRVLKEIPGFKDRQE